MIAKKRCCIAQWSHDVNKSALVLLHPWNTDFKILCIIICSYMQSNGDFQLDFVH